MKGQTYFILTMIFIIISLFAVLSIGAVEVNYVLWHSSSSLFLVDKKVLTLHKCY